MADAHMPVPFTVLIVEDESLVRMMAVDMLEDAGFQVIEASTGDAAWIILQSRNDIDVLFTDIEMPGSLNGFGLANRVAEYWPHIRLVITSGRCQLTDEDGPDHGRFVPKPYYATQVFSAFERAGRS
ncbi:response regulator [Methylobacterium sp. WL18]|uniref:response regulator n=1 Tax=Methylobacterium sp. WL18 TaxID=2603897 RepID=UPI0011CB213D|nr:response regulator [Methylobacterium sp. WL18]TXN75518.1 response regulator [Methylobacterium sp. WL18]